MPYTIHQRIGKVKWKIVECNSVQLLNRPVTSYSFVVMTLKLCYRRHFVL